MNLDEGSETSPTGELKELIINYAPFLTNHALELSIAIVCMCVIASLRRVWWYNAETRDCDQLSATVAENASQRTSGFSKSFGNTTVDDREGYVFGNMTLAENSWITQDAELNGDDDDDMFETNWKFIPYIQEKIYSANEMVKRSRDFYELMNRRRTLRMFSDRTVPREVIENIILTAGTAPSGAHTEPWTYVVVSDAALKAEIRFVTELEERINYERRMGERWKSDLKKLNTDWQKPFLETVPYLIVVFVQVHGYGIDGKLRQHYYHQTSVAMATGLLMAAIHNAGLVTVTHTPMNAGVRYQELLDRPSNEKFFMLLPVGYPAEDAVVPDLHRKQLSEISVWK